MKSGDLCLIIGGRFSQANTGKVCTLVQIITPKEVYISPDTGKEIRHVGSEEVWLVTGSNLVRRVRLGKGEWCFVTSPHALHLPRHLMPLKGEDEDITIGQCAVNGVIQ